MVARLVPHIPTETPWADPAHNVAGDLRAELDRIERAARWGAPAPWDTPPNQPRGQG